MTQASPQDRKPCPMCGEMIAASAVKCRFCGHYLDPSLKPKTSAASQLTDSILPTDMPASAILSLYFGLGAFLIFPAPLAVICGIVALRALKKDPELSGRGRAWFALIAGVIFTGVLILFIVAINSGGP